MILMMLISIQEILRLVALGFAGASDWVQQSVLVWINGAELLLSRPVIVPVIHLLPIMRQLKVGILGLLWLCRFAEPSLIAFCLVGRPDLGLTSADEVLVGQFAGVGFLSSSGDVPGEGAGVAVTKSVAAKRERTQHSRPAEGLERSVLHNEWENVWLQCLFSWLLFRWLFGVWEGVGTGFRSYGYVVWLFLAGLKEVPPGAVCLSSSQVLAFGQAAVRLERSKSCLESRSLTRRKFWCLFVFVFSCRLCIVFFVKTMVLGLRHLSRLSG